MSHLQSILLVGKVSYQIFLWVFIFGSSFTSSLSFQCSLGKVGAGPVPEMGLARIFSCSSQTLVFEREICDFDAIQFISFFYLFCDVAKTFFSCPRIQRFPPVFSSGGFTVLEMCHLGSKYLGDFLRAFRYRPLLFLKFALV